MPDRKQILVVEDNELNRAFLCEILSGEYKTLEAGDGQEALKILAQHKDSIALILLDVIMPVMDGFTFLDRIREDDVLSLIPVIVTTQSDNEKDEIAALAHGATDYVPKPYRPQVILHRVASLIKLRETAAMVNQFQYDRLTGLYSKEFFYQQVRERLADDPDGEYCIICSNILNFKLVNDLYGVQAGDQLLREIASIAMRTVGDTGLCGRLSGDRFLYFQKRQQEQLDRQFLGHFPDMDVSPLCKSVTMYWGIYEITNRAIPVEQMCDRALLAATSIKGQYHQYFAIYDDSLRNSLLREQTITDAMEAALSTGQFMVYYQPKYSLNSSSLAGAEALVRWIHPEWGFMSPGEFIPLFEKNGFIPRLDKYVWDQVCAQLHQWKAMGLPLLPVSVNVSRLDMYQDDLVETLQSLVKKYDIDPSYLHLEITESAYTDSPGQIVKTVQRLREQGFIVEMDDFGSGYSSLNILGQLSLDVLKLDMQFIQNETSKPASQSILNDVVSMAHKLHLSVVAEGVETRDQMSRLQAVGCDYAQGYFFARPMCRADFEVLWKQAGAQAISRVPKSLQPENAQPCLLIIDEDASYRSQIAQALTGHYRLKEAASTDQALAIIRSGEISVVSAVLLSMTLPGGGAANIMQALHQQPQYWELPILATIPDCNDTETLPFSLEADDTFCKSYPLVALQRRLTRLIEAASFHKRESLLQDQAHRDQLTGLLNRHGLFAALSALRKEDLPLAAYMFDLDNLKEVNDTGGHHAGDQMICIFADLLLRSTRNGDILCRYGGDEFLMILQRMTPEDDVIRKKGDDICLAFKKCFASEIYNASCSVGAALCEADEIPSVELIERADQALYDAKQKHKGHCCLWGKD